MAYSMNSLERVLAVINHEVPDRVPVSLHNFLAVGQFIGCSALGEMLRSGEIMAQAQIECWRKTGHDVIQLENGTIAMAQAIGAEVGYFADEPPRVLETLIKDLKDVEKLNLPDPEKVFPLNENLKATRIVSKELGGKVFV